LAINPHPRENLLFEATAYDRRLLLRLPVALAWLSPIESNDIASLWSREFSSLTQWELFVGWRKTGGWSVYFDVQPVLQFNALNQLRRIYGGGQRYMAVGGRLKLLQRDRLGGHIRFEEQQLASPAEQEVLHTCLLFLRATADLLDESKYTVVGQYPPQEQQLVPNAKNLLTNASNDLQIANGPQAGN
jgi:hypothetical protein